MSPVNGNLISVKGETFSIDGNELLVNEKYVSIDQKILPIDGNLILINGEVVSVNEKYESVNGRCISIDQKLLPVNGNGIFIDCSDQAHVQ